MALVDAGMETSVVYSDPTKFQGERVMIGGFVGQTIPVTQTWLKLGVGCLLPQEYKLSIAPVPEYILALTFYGVWLSRQLWDCSNSDRGALVSGQCRQY